MGFLRDSTNTERPARQQESESKREEFRKYLERSGVIDAITKVLVRLYDEPEKPEDALEFVRKNLGGRIETESEQETENLKKELNSARNQIEELQAKLENLELQETSA